LSIIDEISNIVNAGKFFDPIPEFIGALIQHFMSGRKKSIFFFMSDEYRYGSKIIGVIIIVILITFLVFLFKALNI